MTPWQPGLDLDVYEALSILRTKPAFSNIGEKEMIPMARRAHRRVFAKGEQLVQHGRHSDALLLMLRGRVKVERTFELARPQFITELGPGDLIGEMGSFSGIARNATVTAMEEVEALEWTGHDLDRVLHHDHPFMVALVRIINERYRAH